MFGFNESLKPYSGEDLNNNQNGTYVNTYKYSNETD